MLLSYAEEDNIGRTKLLAKSGMSYTQFNSYLTSLIEKEFLEEIVEEGGHKFYAITGKGSFLLDDLSKVIKKIR